MEGGCKSPVTDLSRSISLAFATEMMTEMDYTYPSNQGNYKCVNTEQLCCQLGSEFEKRTCRGSPTGSAQIALWERRLYTGCGCQRARHIMSLGQGGASGPPSATRGSRGPGRPSENTDFTQDVVAAGLADSNHEVETRSPL